MAPQNPAREKRRHLDARWVALKNERSTWLTKWEDHSRHMRPRGFRRNRSEVNKGDNKHQDVINFVPLEAARTLASGMMTGITSPARPWFRLTLPSEPELGESQAVKEWLDQVTRELLLMLARSNLYKALYLVYADLGPFCTSCMLVEADDVDGVRAYVFPVGSYCLDTGPRGDVDTVFREMSLTVKQMVKLFGVEKCSETVRRLYSDGNLSQRFDVLHAIYPNEDFTQFAIGPRGKRWASVWWEAACTDESAGLLRESGYDTFPVMAPRWVVTGEDVYGTGPGFDAIGDCRALQQLERRKAQAVDKVVTPPMVGPTSARNQQFAFTPGYINFADGLGAGAALRPAVEVNPQAIGIIAESIQRHEDRINRAFYAHLFLLVAQLDRQKTATEVEEIQTEKLQLLGPIVEGLGDELLDPLIDRLFELGLREGRFPPPPEEIQGLDTKPEYTSILAAAQKALGTTNIRQLTAFVGNLTAVAGPEVLDKLDLDRATDAMGEALGTPPNLLRTDDEVAKRRNARAQAQQQQQAMEQAVQGAQAAKQLADTNMQGDTALNAVLRSAGVPQ